jgi:hypothetical protein
MLTGMVVRLPTWKCSVLAYMGYYLVVFKSHFACERVPGSNLHVQQTEKMLAVAVVQASVISLLLRKVDI